MDIIKLIVMVPIVFFANMVLADATASNLEKLKERIEDVEKLEVEDINLTSFPRKIAVIQGLIRQINQSAFGPADRLLNKTIDEFFQRHSNSLGIAMKRFSEKEYGEASQILKPVKDSLTKNLEKLNNEKYFVSARKIVKGLLIRLHEKLIQLIDEMLKITE